MKKSEFGQALILMVVGMIGLIGLTALTIDGGSAYLDRRQAQNAADSAAVAGGLAVLHGQSWQAAAMQMAASNGYVDDGTNAEVSVYYPPIEGTFAGDDEYIQVTIVSYQQTSLSKLVGVTRISNRVTAVAHATPADLQNYYFGNAVVALKESGRGAMRSHGDSNAFVYGGGLFSNSDDTCSFEQVGNSVLVAPDGGVNIVGGACLHGNIQPADAITVGVPAVVYPPANLPPEPVCSNDATQAGSNLNPGYWEGIFPPKGVSHLNPGVYCVDGAFKVNAGDVLEGSEVMIYMIDGDIHWNGHGEISLSAPTSGPYAGLLIYMPMSNSDGIILNGNAESSLVGTVLAPASDIQVNGTGETDSYYSQFIGYTVDLIGNMQLIINYDDNQNYKAPIPPTLELAE